MLRSTLLLLCIAIPAMAVENPPLELQLVATKTTYPWPSDKSPKDFTAELENAREAIKVKRQVELPNPIPVEFKLKITNKGKEDVTLYVEGDPNIWTLDVDGKSVIDLVPNLVFTLEFRIPKVIKLEAGASHEIEIKKLSDGKRGLSRRIYWSEPGEYTIKASYLLSNAKGEKGALLTSTPLKVIVEAPK